MGTDNLHKRAKNKISRRKPTRPLNKVILIVCEGKKTEKNYFQRLKECLNLISVSIEIFPSPHPTPLQVVKYAKQKAKEVGECDEIYCVFDRDTHSDFNEALPKAKKTKLKHTIFEAIVSDPCFEFWMLLHFTKITPNFSASQSPCDALQKHKTFKQHLPNYDKSNYDFDGIIANRLNTAIKNANEINKTNLPTRQTPYIPKLLGLWRICKNWCKMIKFHKPKISANEIVL